MEIFEKRGKWCFLEVIEDQGIRKLHKFRTEEEAKIAAGWVPPVEEILDGSKEEEESSEEEASTDEQAPVLSRKIASKKKV
jgi:hypothetical protein